MTSATHTQGGKSTHPTRDRVQSGLLLVRVQGRGRHRQDASRCAEGKGLTGSFQGKLRYGTTNINSDGTWVENPNPNRIPNCAGFGVCVIHRNMYSIHTLLTHIPNPHPKGEAYRDFGQFVKELQFHVRNSYGLRGASFCDGNLLFRTDNDTRFLWE